MDTIPGVEISCYIICKNEEKYIEAALRSVAFCQEIIVVDSGSTDATAAIVQRLIAEGMPIRWFVKEWPGYSAQKQFALEQCTREWCLSIDADERIDPDALPELARRLLSARENGWRLKFSHYLYGYGYAPETTASPILRLTRNGKAFYKPDLLVHEGLSVEGKIGQFRQRAILHRGVLDTKNKIAKELNYAELKARQLHARGKRPRYVRLVFNPLIYFLRVYFLRMYALAGWPGFVHAARLAVYSFTTEAILFEMHRHEVPPGEDDPDAIFFTGRGTGP